MLLALAGLQVVLRGICLNQEPSGLRAEDEDFGRKWINYPGQN